MPHVGVLFCDIQGSSKITGLDNQERFVSEVLEPLAGEIHKYKGKGKDKGLIDCNTWGDAIFATFENILNLALLALKIRDFFMHSAPIIGGEKLKIRIALDV